MTSLSISNTQCIWWVTKSKHWMGVPAVLLLGGFSDPWAVEWPGEESYSRMCLSHLHLPLSNRNTCISVHLLLYQAFYGEHEYCCCVAHCTSLPLDSSSITVLHAPQLVASSKGEFPLQSVQLRSAPWWDHHIIFNTHCYNLKMDHN